MSKSIEEWQEELDSLFPSGATIFRAQTPEGARRAENSVTATQITVLRVDGDTPEVEVFGEGSWFESLILRIESIASSGSAYVVMTSNESNPATLWYPIGEDAAA